MVERKQFKTRLCLLFKRGRCSRQTCSFAHGDAELRRFSNSFNGRQDHRVGDLRDKIGRRHSPIRRYSPGRDARVRRPSQGYNHSRSFGKRSDRKHKKRQQDGQSDYSGSLKLSDNVEDQVNDRKAISSNPTNILDEQVRQVHSEIEMLEDHKTRLKSYLEERIQEANTLTSRVQELEMQLCKEKDECKRITLKTMKFIKAQNQHSRLQEEFMRSQDRLLKLGEQLGLDSARSGFNEEEETSINILSDGEAVANHVKSSWTKPQRVTSPSNKRKQILVAEGDEKVKQVIPAECEGLMRKSFRSGKLLHRDVHRDQLENNKEASVKFKDTESGFTLPSISRSTHLVNEVVETDGNIKVVENSNDNRFSLPLPPPPPLPENAYLQYRGDDDENVDVDGLEEETVDVDIV